LSRSHMNAINATFILSVRKLRTAELIFMKFDFNINIVTFRFGILNVVSVFLALDDER
jgi:hypothetical protein